MVITRHHDHCLVVSHVCLGGAFTPLTQITDDTLATLEPAGHTRVLSQTLDLLFDHSIVVVRYAPQLELEFRKRKHLVGTSWPTDETYIKDNGKQTYLYRAVDKAGDTIDFMLSERRDRKAAMAFFEKAIGSSGLPEKINIDKNGANTAALERLNTLFFMSGLWFLMMEVRRVKYLNKVVEQDHRAIKRITKYTLGFKTFKSAEAMIAGIELCHMLKKGQMKNAGGQAAWQQFYKLAA